MTDPVTIPLWLFLVLIGLGILAVLDRMLLPSVRWFLRRKVSRLLDEIGHRLDLQIRPFQLTRRQVLIDRLVYDAQVMAAIEREARRLDIPRDTARTMAARYAREIVPSFNAYLYFRIGYWLAKTIARMLYRVHVGMVNIPRLKAVNPESAVVFVMNHRSNMDYVLVAFLAAERTTLSYAVGEWAKIWPLQSLIRAMGAYFVRRNSKDALYRKVLSRYVEMATREGVCQAVFPEGGLTRDGHLRRFKLGILNYMLRKFDPEHDRDIVFIPIGINYDRVLEDRSLLRTLDPLAEKRSRWFIVKTSVVFSFKCLTRLITSRWRRFGYAGINFGVPVSMREYCRKKGIRFDTSDAETRFADVESLGRELMQSVQQVLPVLPVPVVATLFVENPTRSFNAFEVEDRANAIIDDIRKQGGPVFVSSRSRVQNIISALHMLTIRHLVTESEGLYRAAPENLDVMAFYANSISHWRSPPAESNS